MLESSPVTRALQRLLAIIVFSSGGVTCLYAAPDAVEAISEQAVATAPALPQVVIVGRTPLDGTETPVEQIPQVVHSLGSNDINRTGIASLTGAIIDNVPSVTINDTEGNLFQPDVLFRGFAASPVAGTPQGLAVYLNGARFNDAFGDTVNWDLFRRLQLSRLRWKQLIRYSG